MTIGVAADLALLPRGRAHISGCERMIAFSRRISLKRKSAAALRERRHLAGRQHEAGDLRGAHHPRSGLDSSADLGSSSSWPLLVMDREPAPEIGPSTTVPIHLVRHFQERSGAYRELIGELFADAAGCQAARGQQVPQEPEILLGDLDAVNRLRAGDHEIGDGSDFILLCRGNGSDAVFSKCIPARWGAESDENPLVEARPREVLDVGCTGSALTIEGDIPSA